MIPTPMIPIRNGAMMRVSFDGDLSGEIRDCLRFVLLMPVFVEKAVEDRRGCEGRYNRHDNEHGKELRRDDSQVQSYIQNDQLHQPACVHENSEGSGVAPTLSGEPRRHGRASELPK